MRVIIAGVLAGLVLFVWSFLVHAVLPLGQVGMQAPRDEAPVLAALQAGLPEAGLYFLPYIAPEQMGDAAAVEAWRERAARSPYALVIFEPQGGDQVHMGRNLALQWVNVTVAGVLVAWLLSLVPATLGRRIGLAAVLGAVAWLSVSVPYWIWYRFPLDFTLAALVEHVLGWTLAGAAAAWWLQRGRARGA